mgnify:CR=1 FL=1
MNLVLENTCLAQPPRREALSDVTAANSSINQIDEVFNDGMYDGLSFSLSQTEHNLKKHLKL